MFSSVYQLYDQFESCLASWDTIRKQSTSALQSKLDYFTKLSQPKHELVSEIDDSVRKTQQADFFVKHSDTYLYGLERFQSIADKMYTIVESLKDQVKSNRVDLIFKSTATSVSPMEYYKLMDEITFSYQREAIFKQELASKLESASIEEATKLLQLWQADMHINKERVQVVLAKLRVGVDAFNEQN